MRQPLAAHAWCVRVCVSCIERATKRAALALPRPRPGPLLQVPGLGRQQRPPSLRCSPRMGADGVEHPPLAPPQVWWRSWSR